MLEEFSLQFEYLQYRVIYPLRTDNLILEKKEIEFHARIFTSIRVFAIPIIISFKINSLKSLVLEKIFERCFNIKRYRDRISHRIFNSKICNIV